MTKVLQDHGMLKLTVTGLTHYLLFVLQVHRRNNAIVAPKHETCQQSAMQNVK